MNLDALVTAREAQDYPPLKAHGVCRHLIGMWRAGGRLTVRSMRGRSPEYRFGDILRVERDTRLSGTSHRLRTCRSCERSTTPRSGKGAEPRHIGLFGSSVVPAA